MAVDCTPALPGRETDCLGRMLHLAVKHGARIPIVADGAARPAAEVRRAHKRLRPLEKIKAEKRG